MARVRRGEGAAGARVGATTLVIGAALFACRGPHATGPERPIEVLISTEIDTLDPRYAYDAMAIRTTRLVHAGLVRLDETTLEPRPYVAKSWSWVDARTLRVELRDDVRFHSGAPVTPADVVATLRAFGSPKVASRHARVVDAIADARPDGARGVLITLSRAHATLLTDLELPILRADQAESPPDPRGALDGLGPYAIGLAARGAIELVPQDGSALPRPRHALSVRTVRDENARASRLLAGRADVAVNQISPTLLPAIAREPHLTVRGRPGANLTYLLARHTHPALARVEVRRAISLAIDRRTLTSSMLAGRAQPAAGAIPEGHWAHVGDGAALPFDPPRARAALEGAGVPPLALLTSTDRLRISLARVMAQELRDVGLTVEVIPLELGTLLARLNAGDFDLATLTIPELTEPHVLRHFLHSAFVPPAGANRGRVRDPELDALLERGGAATDRDERRVVYAKLDARIRETLPIIPLWREDQVSVTSARAGDFTASAEGRWLGLAAIR